MHRSFLICRELFITKITSVSPNYKGQQIWLDCLDLIFQGNQELIDYVQMICGLAAIGKVYVEALIIAYGQKESDQTNRSGYDIHQWHSVHTPARESGNQTR